MATKDSSLWPSLWAFNRQPEHKLIEQVGRALLPTLSVIVVRLAYSIVAWPLALLRLLDPDPRVRDSTALAFFNAKPCCIPHGLEALHKSLP